jgi:hypothetical protein
VYCSCIAHFSTRHTVAHRPANTAALVVPQGAYRSLSRRFRRHQIMARMTLVYGPWTSCRSARWEAGHRTGHTCESPVVIFDQARDVPVQRKRKGTRSFAYTWTIPCTIQNLLVCLTADCRNWGNHSRVYLTSLPSPVPMALCLAAPHGFPNFSCISQHTGVRLDASLERYAIEFKNGAVICLIYSMVYVEINGQGQVRDKTLRCMRTAEHGLMTDWENWEMGRSRTV